MTDKLAPSSILKKVVESIPKGKPLQVWIDLKEKRKCYEIEDVIAIDFGNNTALVFTAESLLCDINNNKRNDQNGEYIRIKEASEITGLKETYLRNLSQKGDIPCYKNGKFTLFKKEEIILWAWNRINKKEKK